MMNEVADDRKRVLMEIADIPDEFIPFILKQVKAYKDSLTKRGNRKKSPAKRLLKLAGVLENSKGLSVAQYKETVVDEYLSQRL
jgi:hypothetical protein